MSETEIKAKLLKDFKENPHPPIYWGPDETYDQAVAREIDCRRRNLGLRRLREERKGNE